MTLKLSTDGIQRHRGGSCGGELAWNDCQLFQCCPINCRKAALCQRQILHCCHGRYGGSPNPETVAGIITLEGGDERILANEPRFNGLGAITHQKGLGAVGYSRDRAEQCISVANNDVHPLAQTDHIWSIKGWFLPRMGISLSTATCPQDRPRWSIIQ